MSKNVLSIDGDAAADPARPAYYFDFAPVLERSQALRRNPERAQLMCENCVRRLAPSDIMLAEDSGFFLIILSAEGHAAEALANEINIALLELFFGTDALNHNLGSICRKATLAEIESKGIVIPPPPKAADRTGQIEADPLARLAQGGLPGYDGLTTGFAPLINLSRETSALFLSGAVRQKDGKTLFGMEALSGTDPRDRASLDEAMLEYSLSHARGVLPTRSATAIMTPVHYETLAWSRGRQLYQKALRHADAAGNPFLLVKIEGVPSGTPAARLTEVIAMVRPFVRRVFVELAEWDQNLVRGGMLGAAGYMATLAQSASLAMAGRTMSNLVQLAAAQQAVACIANIEGANHLALARSAGVRFAVRSTAGGVIQTGLTAPEDQAHAA
jgi:hypothetical protein